MKIHTGPKPLKMVKCPTCVGTGTQTIETTMRSPGKVEKSSTTILCIICKGAAVITQNQMKALEREQSLWCSCKTASTEDVIFHDDGECRDCNKHHYHCGTCQKICQVG